MEQYSDSFPHVSVDFLDQSDRLPIGQQYTHLIACSASGFEGLGVVSPAKHLTLPEEVDEIDEELFAHAAHEASWVPGNVGACTRGKDGHVPWLDLIFALQEKMSKSMGATTTTTT